MKFSLFLLVLLTSCADYSTQKNFSTPYTSKGFAFISTNENESLNNKYLISVSNIKSNKKIRISNPENNKFIDLKNSKRDYDNFYKAFITPFIASELELDLKFPYIEVSEIKRNKSFIAEKAITDNAEKKIANNAPIDQIDINNISKKKKNIQKVKSYSILVADFYSLESAKILKNKLALILANSNYHLIYINKKNESSYELLLGPYNTINKLKNDYIVLSDSSFEDLDIKINE